MSAAVVVCGVPAAGKSTLADYLSAALAWPVLSLDAERQARLTPGDWIFRHDPAAWASLATQLTAIDPCIVELSGSGWRTPYLFRSHQTFTILCTASPSVRAARLHARIDTGYWASSQWGYVSKLLRFPPPQVRPAAVWDSSASPGPELATPLVDRIRGWHTTIATAPQVAA